MLETIRDISENSFSYLFIKRIFIGQLYIPGTVMGAEGMALNITDTNSYLSELKISKYIVYYIIMISACGEKKRRGKEVVVWMGRKGDLCF